MDAYTIMECLRNMGLSLHQSKFVVPGRTLQWQPRHDRNYLLPSRLEQSPFDHESRSFFLPHTNRVDNHRCNTQNTLLSKNAKPNHNLDIMPLDFDDWYYRTMTPFLNQRSCQPGIDGSCLLFVCLLLPRLAVCRPSSHALLQHNDCLQCFLLHSLASPETPRSDLP